MALRPSCCVQVFYIVIMFSVYACNMQGPRESENKNKYNKKSGLMKQNTACECQIHILKATRGTI